MRVHLKLSSFLGANDDTEQECTIIQFLDPKIEYQKLAQCFMSVFLPLTFPFDPRPFCCCAPCEFSFMYFPLK